MARRRLTLRWAALGMAAIVATTPVHAQETQVFSLTNYRFELFAEGSYYRDRSRRNDTTTRQQELWLREGLEMWSDGFIYHPNFLDWHANVRAGLSHDKIWLNNESRQETGHLLGYNLSAHALKDKPISGRVFASLDSQVIGRSFAGPIELDRRTEGAEVFYRGPVDASVLFRHQDTSEDSAFREQDSRSLLTRVSVTDRRDSDFYTRFIYEHEELDRTTRFRPQATGSPIVQDLGMTRDEAQLINRWVFGDDALPHRLSGRTRFLHQRGFLDRDRASVNQRLDLSHTHWLSSFYGGAFVWDDTDFQTEHSVSGEVGATAQVYESLTVTPRADVSHRRFDNGQRQSLGLLLDTDYRKQTRLGELRSTVHVGRRFEEESFEASVRNISNEPVRLTGLAFSALGHTDVVAGSVFVTDATNTVTYFEGVDYELRVTGSVTEIRRIVTGDIEDGDTVLVSYTVTTARDARYDTDILRWRIRFDFEDLPLAAYFEYALRDEKLRSGNATFNPERDERILFGSEVTLGDLTIIPEYERRNLRVAPSWDAYRVRATYVRPISRDTHLNASAHYEMLEYRDPAAFGLEPGRDFLESYGAQGRITSKVRDDTVLRFDASYLKTRGRNNDELWRFGPSVTWARGLMEVSVSGYQSFYRQESRRGNRTYASFSLRREF